MVWRGGGGALKRKFSVQYQLPRTRGTGVYQSRGVYWDVYGMLFVSFKKSHSSAEYKWSNQTAAVYELPAIQPLVTLHPCHNWMSLADTGCTDSVRQNATKYMGICRGQQNDGNLQRTTKWLHVHNSLSWQGGQKALSLTPVYFLALAKHLVR